MFLIQARREAQNKAKASSNFPAKKKFCEIEARIGILKSVQGGDRRVLSSGPKRISDGNGNHRIVHAFNCTSERLPPRIFESGITRTHFVNWTSSGLSEESPISQVLAVPQKERIKQEIVEEEMVETVYSGYSDSCRVCYNGDYFSQQQNGHHSSAAAVGGMEKKQKLCTMDVALPSSPYDLRIGLATEVTIDPNVKLPPPQGWTSKRLKRRKSYFRKDKSMKWQLDVTEVISTNQSGMTNVGYEVEFELNPDTTLNLINEANDDKANKLCKNLALQLHYMVGQINPQSDVLDVEEFLVDHNNAKAVQLALAQCGSLKRYMDSRRNGNSGHVSEWTSAIAENGESQTPSASLYNIKFPGCMPFNFQRHNIEEVQRSDSDGGYFLSEKTDGVRHLMVFTGRYYSANFCLSLFLLFIMFNLIIIYYDYYRRCSCPCRSSNEREND